ncbi:GlxA family transcriptional regulator [Halomonas sp. DP5N14-9]|uniref:GlxA family transcriptional regulator n=1 Tax=Halomonas sp. DP5N14-9 TaxID=2859075 RepID=UPI0028F73FAF|nr:helix-turn-helix domain-containing protein [Halomonas sp. DP5N14-9]
MTTTRDVALLAYPDCQMLDVSGPWQAFASANDVLGKPAYRLRLIGRSASELVTNGGLRLLPDLDWEEWESELDKPPDAGGNGRDLTTLLIAGGHGVFVQCQQQRWRERLTRVAPHLGRLGAVCTGAFLLADAGLLNGRSATTHWRHCRRLADDFPQVRVQADALYVHDGGRYTSAGVTAGIDLALSLVESDLGAEAAAAVARELVMFLHRPGGQSQFSELLSRQHRCGPRLRPLIDRLHADPGGAFDLESMADSLKITPRHLTRLFRHHLDTSPGEYLTGLRLEAARRELVRGETSLERLASRWHLGTSEQLRRQFHRHYGVSPSVYRARFGADSANHR